MSASSLRILLLADTHLGFDSPVSPRVARRRRGPDFFANFERALEPARRGGVDLVVHGGDLFYRRKVPAALIDKALMPLAEIARNGVPVFVVPGNHEGSRIPLHLATAHPNLYIFHDPRTVVLNMTGTTVSLTGFPFARRIGENFSRLLDECARTDLETDFRLLCLHQTVEGARVGAHNYTFRQGSEVISGKDIPGAFDAILCGHIHRSQLLTRDLVGRPLPAPVIYPGSTERTSFAERNETKHYALVTLARTSAGERLELNVEFVELPTRPMIMLTVHAEGLDAVGLRDLLSGELGVIDPDAIVRVRIEGQLSEELTTVATAATLRSLAPPTMNVTLAGFAGTGPS